MSDTGAGLIFIATLILALALVHVPLGDYLARCWPSAAYQSSSCTCS
jgi:K+-transporting ATPase ATPase A chain